MATSGFALMFGNLEGRVAMCFPVPKGMTIRRRGKKVSKICLPRQYGAGSTIFVKDSKGRARPMVSTAFVERLGKGKGRKEAIEAFKFTKGDKKLKGAGMIGKGKGKRLIGYELPKSRLGKPGKTTGKKRKLKTTR